MTVAWRIAEQSLVWQCRARRKNCKPTLDHHSPLGAHQSQLRLCNVSFWQTLNWEETGNIAQPVCALQRNRRSGDGWTWILKSNIPSFISLKHRWLKIQYGEAANDSTGREANLGNKTREKASGEFAATEGRALKYTNLFIWKSAEALWLQVARGGEKVRESTSRVSHVYNHSFPGMTHNLRLIEWSKCRRKWLKCAIVQSQMRHFSIIKYVLLFLILIYKDNYKYNVGWILWKQNIATFL